MSNFSGLEARIGRTGKLRSRDISVPLEFALALVAASGVVPGVGSPGVQGYLDDVTSTETLIREGASAGTSQNFLTAPGTLRITAANAADQGGDGTGARSFLAVAVNRFFEREDVVLTWDSGESKYKPVGDDDDYWFVESFSVLSAGGGGANAGVCTAAIGGTTMSTMNTGTNQGSQAAIIVGPNQYGLLWQVTFSCATKASSVVRLRGYAQPCAYGAAAGDGGYDSVTIERPAYVGLNYLTGTGAGTFHREYRRPIVIPPGTRVYWTATEVEAGGAGVVPVTLGFGMHLISKTFVDNLADN